MAEFVAFSDAGSGLRLATFGDCAGARALAAASLQRFPNGNNRVPAALALALCGDPAKAKPPMDAFEKEYPGNTMLHLPYRPMFLAALSLQQGKPDEAVVALESARRAEMGNGPASFTFVVPYFRGLAYLKKNDGAPAATELKRILDAQYLNPISFFILLSQLQLARAYALQGDSAKARTAYQDFLASWKDADADIPILKEGKSEYAKLQ
jgi:predicted Zn-dependent protease